MKNTIRTSLKNIYLCLCCKSLCALLLTGSIWDHDVTEEICTLPRIGAYYIVLELELETMSFFSYNVIN